MSQIAQRLERLPFGRFHHKLLLMGGLGYMFEAVDAAIISNLMRRGEPRASNPPPSDRGEPASRRTGNPPVSPDQGHRAWLSDLMNRAEAGSSGQPRDATHAGSVQPDAPPLESLSLDISRLIDRKLAGEMRDRYQRRESKAFIEDLYAPAGQMAFDEVARKYRSEPSFKQTVDRYIFEFGRLLEEVARDERGPQALRAQLASETGLVYTLLAHAAGRLG